MYKIEQDSEYWKNKLSPEAYHVLREKGTERPFSGKYNMHFESGIYTCGGCGEPLFESQSKFDGHCGWPSFDSELDGNKILKLEDRSHGMVRTEIVCAKCGGHLGHLFDDGPTATGLRYCVNSLSLGFVPAESKLDTLVVAGGCFWCIESAFNYLDGVHEAVSGYSGGHTLNPTYEQVCSGTTGHAEVVRIVYDQTKISENELLDMFFTLHDPTQLNRQGNDIGTQYRSALFYRDDKQKKRLEAYIQNLKNHTDWAESIQTTLEPLKVFYRAEDYHQRYFEKNPQNAYCQAVVRPKLDKFKHQNQSKLKK